ncbi:N-formylglutamate amidohydrolase [candidate division KSB1 bacterium]
MKKLPVIISIPHGGSRIPEEIAEYVGAGMKDIFNDSDAFTQEIYNLSERVEAVVTAEVARAFVDVNRAREDRPPQNPDGVVKSHTCFNVPVYRKGRLPEYRTVEKMLDRCYEPFHLEIRRLVEKDGIKLGLDCHSMAAVGPPLSPFPGRRREAAICLGNRHGESCGDDITNRLASCFRKAFSLDKRAVAVNEPFSGGFITRTFGMKPVPWIQVELNRSLYLADPWFDDEALRVDPTRLGELNAMFENTIGMFFDKP